MWNTRLARRHLEWRPQGRRPFGRPRKRWIDWIQEALEKRGFQLMDVEDRRSFEDRSTWRDVIKCSPTDRWKFTKGMVTGWLKDLCITYGLVLFSTPIWYKYIVAKPHVLLRKKFEYVFSSIAYRCGLALVYRNCFIALWS